MLSSVVVSRTEKFKFIFFGSFFETKNRINQTKCGFFLNA